ncbi:ADP-ribosylglycohydrolase family protein [Anaerobiospirillum sp. NML120449]|uniref:ADP-ribosylglycohydrolase family protein n=1 Tax=Anaerobiospirillum sp. NML120449 TaxID=2932817 RepID=UPI001FF3C505|nr:ADP-ribosylglycohydrolase family protein [Anaerobiospirillum sp. NML120449]MCK0525937.1 ADP-ribosylglycohydrolase family protein [Anaerobiospirillum sp. NML120449]
MSELPMKISVEDMAIGSMLGAAYGDALGWPWERAGRNKVDADDSIPRFMLRSWQRIGSYGAYRYRESMKPGTCSDDTQMILCVSRSLLMGERWFEHSTTRELPFWAMYERGGGGATKRSIKAWAAGQAPWSKSLPPESREDYFMAGGNGVAMRVLPHVIRGFRSDFRLTAERIFIDGITTHGHPVALAGALAYGYALWLMIRHSINTVSAGQHCQLDLSAPDASPGRSAPINIADIMLSNIAQWSMLPDRGVLPEDWTAGVDGCSYDWMGKWGEAIDSLRQYLTIAAQSMAQGGAGHERDMQVMTALHCFDPAIKGAGTVAAAAAIYLAQSWQHQPVEGVISAAFARGSDTDTIASMCGGLLGCMKGSAWLAQVRSHIQDEACLCAYALKLAQASSDPLEPAGPALYTLSPNAEVPSEKKLAQWKKWLFSQYPGPSDSLPLTEAHYQGHQENGEDKGISIGEVMLPDGRTAHAAFFTGHAFNPARQRLTCALVTADGQSMYINILIKVDPAPEPAPEPGLESGSAQSAGHAVSPATVSNSHNSELRPEQSAGQLPRQSPSESGNQTVAGNHIVGGADAATAPGMSAAVAVPAAQTQAQKQMPPLQQERTDGAVSSAPVCLKAGFKLTAASFDRSLAFYRDALGLRVKKKNAGTVSFEQGLVLVSSDYLSRKAGMDDWLGLRSLIYIEVADLDLSFSRLSSAGVKILSTPAPWGKSGMSCFRCLDPDGNVVEVFGKTRG